MEQSRCRCLVTLRGTDRCMHSKHEKYRLPVVQDADCVACPLKVGTDEAGQPVLPSKIDQAKHLSRDMARAAADGFTFASERCQHERELVCMGCPLLSRNKRRCTACGCNLKFKRKLREWTCDLGYWDHIPTDIQVVDQLDAPTVTPAELDGEKPLEVLSKEEVEARRKICENCPSNKRRGRRCSVCTCNIYVKTLSPDADCPLGHWPKR